MGIRLEEPIFHGGGNARTTKRPTDGNRIIPPSHSILGVGRIFTRWRFFSGIRMHPPRPRKVPPKKRDGPTERELVRRSITRRSALRISISLELLLQHFMHLFQPRESHSARLEEKRSRSPLHVPVPKNVSFFDARKDGNLYLKIISFRAPQEFYGRGRHKL